MIARDGVGVPSNWHNACGLHWPVWASRSVMAGFPRVSIPQR